MGSDQGWNPCPLQWKHGVLTTGLPGKFLERKVFNHPSQNLTDLVEKYNKVRKSLNNTKIRLIEYIHTDSILIIPKKKKIYYFPKSLFSYKTDYILGHKGKLNKLNKLSFHRAWSLVIFQ